MLSLAFISFIAGILTILAPCVLPVLPVILVGSLTEKKKWYPYVVTFSLAFSIVLFTFLLKVSTLFLDISPSFWKYFSGMILVFLGCIYIFPHIWTNIGIRFGFSRSSNTLDSAQDIANPLFRAIVTGTALGPVFSSCSPTYTLLLATVFPVSLVSGVFYTAIYALGLSFILLIITIFGTSVIKRLKVFADERGLFRRFLGIILLLVGLLIFTGVDKKIETYLVTHYDVNSIETGIIKKISPNHPIIMNTEQKTMIGDTASSSSDVKMERAYFAGGCFWCMEGIFEAQAGVKEAISGYAGGEQKDANYDTVSSGNTKHREAVEVIYDPSRIRFETLVDLYYTQIDPTQVDGQFADRGYQYTTAIYYKNEEEKKIVENAKKVLQDSKKFEKPIAVQTVPFTTFFPAEDYHQDYYKKSAFRYSLYKAGSGRAGFIEKNGQTGGTLAPAETPKKSQYRPYDGKELQTLGNGQILLFFHAEWCSTCQNFDKQISETLLPENLIIYQVDYDSAIELKKKYSILSQSTWVQVDSTGKAYKRWLGKSQLSDILSDLVSVRDILSQKLTPLQFEVTQMGATERPFDNAYWDNHEPGIYVDIVDGTPLFSSTDKFDSGTGWPSFSRPISESILSEHLDTKLEQNRTEVKSTGGSHLGHVFNDGPSEEGGLRYCINSAALRFIPVADLEKEGYGEYGRLFGSGFIQK